MQLLMSSASPFARKVRVLIVEAGIDDIEEINISTTPLATDPAVMAVNPAGKIPALLRDDGPALYDSRVITRYLDAQTGAGLYPAARLWEVLTIEATADAILDAAVLMVYEARCRAPEMQAADWVAGQWGKVSRAVAALNEQWMSHLSGPLDMAQIAVACALSYLDFRHAGRDWRGANPALADWQTAFAARNSMVATAPA